MAATAPAAAAASGTRPLLFRRLRWNASFRLAAAPGSVLGHRSPPPADRTSGRCPALGTGGGDRPCPGEQRVGVASAGQALPCP